jgi:hypothetical protein
MRTRLILAEGANHAQINPPSTHSRCVHLECDEVEVGPRASRHFWQRCAGVPANQGCHAPKCAMAMPTTAASSPPMVCIMPKRYCRRR